MQRLIRTAARGLLLLAGSAATLTGCGNHPVYGMPDAAYGMPSCYEDLDCTRYGEGWYCGEYDRCVFVGEPDAGSDVDGGN